MLLLALACRSTATPPSATPHETATPPESTGDTAAGTVPTTPESTGSTGATGSTGDTAAPTAPPASNRDRLLQTYLSYLQLDPAKTQSNGLRGQDLADVCALWDALDPSSQATFLTITARLDGSILAFDGSTMLDHVTTLYRAVGGEGATASDPGSCGGGEYNRLMMSMDDVLHDALVSANRAKGKGTDIADIPSGGVWRDSHDLAGPHTPFTLSDETKDGAPRGQVQFFEDLSASEANAPLGRLDLEDLVDPRALEMDHDYDCVHNSNPSCEYTFYGPLCAPKSTELGTDIYEATYGTFDPGWQPSGC